MSDPFLHPGELWIHMSEAALGHVVFLNQIYHTLLDGHRVEAVTEDPPDIHWKVVVLHSNHARHGFSPLSLEGVRSGSQSNEFRAVEEDFSEIKRLSVMDMLQGVRWGDENCLLVVDEGWTFWDLAEAASRGPAVFGLIDEMTPDALQGADCITTATLTEDGLIRWTVVKTPRGDPHNKLLRLDPETLRLTEVGAKNSAAGTPWWERL